MNRTGRTGSAALLLLVTVAMLGCSASIAQDDSSRGTLRERLRDRMEQRRQEKAQAHDPASATEKLVQPGNHVFTLEHDGLKRSYLVHVPPSYKPGTPVPLLVSLHGGGANMEYQASDEHYGQISKSDREGFVVVFPNGYSRLPGGKLATFNAGNCCGNARDRNIDDVGFIRKMIDNLTQQLDIDRRKIFATGMSNGGLMAHRLACEMSDTFKAIAPVAGTDNTKSCSPANPVAVLQIHARDDDNLPFNGGKGKNSRGSAVTDFTAVPESIARWVKRNGCAAPAKRVLDKPGAYCERYSPCRDNAEVELCVTETGAHSWPGGGKSHSGQMPSKAIIANDVMWDFFMRR